MALHGMATAVATRFYLHVYEQCKPQPRTSNTAVQLVQYLVADNTPSMYCSNQIPGRQVQPSFLQILLILISRVPFPIFGSKRRSSMSHVVMMSGFFGSSSLSRLTESGRINSSIGHLLQQLFADRGRTPRHGRQQQQQQQQAVLPYSSTEMVPAAQLHLPCVTFYSHKEFSGGVSRSVQQQPNDHPIHHSTNAAYIHTIHIAHLGNSCTNVFGQIATRYEFVD